MFKLNFLKDNNKILQYCNEHRNKYHTTQNIITFFENHVKLSGLFGIIANSLKLYEPVFLCLLFLCCGNVVIVLLNVVTINYCVEPIIY